VSWAKVDDGLDEHTKVEALFDGHVELGMLEGDALQELAALAAVGLWTLSLANSSRRLTNGRVTKRVLRAIAPTTHQLLADQLVAVGMFDPDQETGSVVIHDYLDHNPSRDKVLEQRETRAEAGRLGGQRSGEARRRQAKPEAKAEANGSANGQAKGKRKRTPARTRTPIEPPEPPKGGRARDRASYEEELSVWAGEHFPGVDVKQLGALVSWLRGRITPLTADAVREYAATHEQWSLDREAARS
jgi:hypothetical protein